jgi:hypothetical protein
LVSKQKDPWNSSSLEARKPSGHKSRLTFGTDQLAGVPEMKTCCAATALVLMFGIDSSLFSADKPKVVAVDSIKDKVHIKLLEESAIEFQRRGDQLLQPTRSKVKDAKKGTVSIKLEVTSDSPFPPPRKGATRPYLSVENNFEKTLHFRALARLKGSKEFFEINKDMEPLRPESVFLKCWEFDSLVEEVILCEFKLSDAKAD